MATSAKWTIIFEDKKIIKNYDEGASEGIPYNISVSYTHLTLPTSDLV